MKKLFMILLAAAGFSATPASAQTVIGIGSQSSYLVIEATAFGAPLLFEYRYDYNPLNPLTTTDLLLAVDASVADLSFELLYGGAFLNGVTYMTLTLTNSVTPPDYSPFWAQWVSGGESGDPLAPMLSGVWSEGYGPLNRTLAPGSWDGFIFNGAYESAPPYALISAPPSVAPVPEPGTASILVCGAGFLIWARRRTVARGC